VLIFKFEHLDEAIELLSSNGITVLPGERVYNL